MGEALEQVLCVFLLFCEFLSSCCTSSVPAGTAACGNNRNKTREKHSEHVLLCSDLVSAGDNSTEEVAGDRSTRRAHLGRSAVRSRCSYLRVRERDRTRAAVPSWAKLAVSGSILLGVIQEPRRSPHGNACECERRQGPSEWHMDGGMLMLRC